MKEGKHGRKVRGWSDEGRIGKKRREMEWMGKKVGGGHMEDDKALGGGERGRYIEAIERREKMKLEKKEGEGWED